MVPPFRTEEDMGHKTVTDHQHYILKKVCKTSVSSVSFLQIIIYQSLTGETDNFDLFPSATVITHYVSIE